jgi:hypothetical protein
MTRTFLTLLLLTVPLGCGESPGSHRVERTHSGEAKESGAGQALTKPPRAIATH